MYLKRYFTILGKDILVRFPKRVFYFFKFLGEYRQFKKQNDGRLRMKFAEIYPCLTDRVKTTPFDRHYVLHPAWAARVLAQTRPEYHVDISSILSFSTIASAFLPIRFYDYRVAEIDLPNYKSGFADLTNLSFETDSIPSISCMHTIEHIGLGRYGDPIDPKADLKAINELIRVVRKGGDILFVAPLGDGRIEFNGQRLYSKEQVLGYFGNCTLMNFTLIPDQGDLIENADNEFIQKQKFPCGCFWFRKQ